MSTQLGQIANSTTAFTALNQAYMIHVAAVAATIERMREQVQQLCATPGERTTSEFSQRSGYYMFRYSHKCVINMCICIASIERKARLLLLLLLQSRTQQ